MSLLSFKSFLALESRSRDKRDLKDGRDRPSYTGRLSSGWLVTASLHKKNAKTRSQNCIRPVTPHAMPCEPPAGQTPVDDFTVAAGLLCIEERRATWRGHSVGRKTNGRSVIIRTFPATSQATFVLCPRHRRMPPAPQKNSVSLFPADFPLHWNLRNLRLKPSCYSPFLTPFAVFC